MILVKFLSSSLQLDTFLDSLLISTRDLTTLLVQPMTQLQISTETAILFDSSSILLLG